MKHYSKYYKSLDFNSQRRRHLLLAVVPPALLLILMILFGLEWTLRLNRLLLLLVLLCSLLNILSWKNLGDVEVELNKLILRVEALEEAASETESPTEK